GEVGIVDEMAVALDVAALAADDEHDQVVVAGVRELARGRRLDVAQAAGAELAHLSIHLEPRRALVDEVELVLDVVVVLETLEPGRHHDRVDAERVDAERPPDLAEAVALAELVDRTDRGAHGGGSTDARGTAIPLEGSPRRGPRGGWAPRRPPSHADVRRARRAARRSAAARRR